MTRSDVELPHEQEDNESEEVTYTTPEELIQVHRLWKMFMDRLEGRSLQFHDVVLREKRREMLEEVCFTSMEVAIVENEWAVIADVLKGCEAAAPANQQPGKDGFSFIPPNSETVAVWEASLTSTVHAIEAFSQTANAALTAIDDCKYRISLYADFLGDQIHRYLHYNNQRRAVHHLPDPGSPAETPMRRAAGKQAPQGLNASVGPIVSVPAFGIREMGIDDPSAKTVRKIDDKAVELLQECDEMKDAVVRWCHWLSTELLPWLLTAMRCVHVARTSAMLVRTRPRFAITYDVLQPLERVYDLRSELPRIYVPVVRPPRSIAEFISPRCSFAGAEANPCDNSPNDEGSPRVRNQPAPRDPAPAPPPAGDSLVSVSEQCAPRPVAAVSLFQKALPKCRRAAAGTPRPFPFPSADDPGDPQEAAGRQQMLKMLSRASLYSDPMIHSFSSSPASAPLRVSGGRPQPSRKHPSPLGDGAENDYGPLLRDDSSATSDGETTPPRLSRRLPFLGDVPKKPPPGHPAPAAPGGPHAAVAGGRRATKGEMAAGAVCLVGKILGFFAAECSATGALPLGTLTVKANDVVKLPSDVDHRFKKIEIEEGGILTTDAWSREKGVGGRLMLRAERIVVHDLGAIDLTGVGYSGGRSLSKADVKQAQQGEGIEAVGGFNTLPNEAGGGGGYADRGKGSSGGGGGGYAKDGSAGRPFARGGKGGNALPLSAMEESPSLGTGGGGGHTFAPCLDSDSETTEEESDVSSRVDLRSTTPITANVSNSFEDTVNEGHEACVRGGNGGGVLLIVCQSFYNSGVISCNGRDGENGPTYGTSGGGGGSGGFIRIATSIEYNNNGIIQAQGGSGGTAPASATSTRPGLSGGNGSDGVVQIRRISSPIFPAPKQPAHT